MSVERNVITCDGQHARPVELVVPDVAPQFVAPARIRSYAYQHAWRPVAGGDFCPECVETLQKPPAPEGWRQS